MSNLAQTDDLFFNRAGLDRARVETITDDALSGTDDGELYLEYSQSESVAYKDGRVRAAKNPGDSGATRAIGPQKHRQRRRH